MSRKVVDQIGLALMVALALVGNFRPSVKLYTECLAVGTALVLACGIWQLSRVVLIAGYLAWAAALALMIVEAIH